jgi:DNA polymerase-4
MMGERKILHLDLDAFFCAVEELRQPELKGVAFAVGGKPNERGVVSSCSYPARQFGVHSAMPMSQALNLCPQLVIIRGHHREYEIASENVMAILRDLTPLVEQVSIDEAFLDVSDLPDPGETIARRLQERIALDTSLPCSIGVAQSKLVAKIATDYGKAHHSGTGSPRAITVVQPGEAQNFLAKLPVCMLWGVGKKTELRLKGLGIETIGELAETPEPVLSQIFGKNGLELSRNARGIDNRPVVIEHEVKSISQEITFERDVSDLKRLRDTLHLLSVQVGYRLRKSDLCAGTIRLKLRWTDFTTLTRQVSLGQPVDQDGVISHAVQSLFDNVWQAGKKVRLLGVGASNLQAKPAQPGLWDTDLDKERRLLSALDELREKFGADAIRPGRTIKPSKRKQDHRQSAD